ncbi:MAG: hypothetical protein ACLR8P_19540 [Clostridium fessum]
MIAFSVALADARLRALRESVEQAHGNDGEIGSDAVSGNTDISGEPHEAVKLKTIAITAGGYFADKGGYAELAAGDQGGAGMERGNGIRPDCVFPAESACCR